MAATVAVSARPDGLPGQVLTGRFPRLRPFLRVWNDQRTIAFLTLANLLLIFIPVVVLSLLLLLKTSQTWWKVIPVCLTAAIAVLWRIYLRDFSQRSQLALMSLFLGFAAVAFLVNGVLFDSTFDGMSYHTEAILHLLRGVNPVYATFDGRYAIWTNHYPKALWYFSAAAAYLTRHFEMGKAYQLILLYACFVYAWGALRIIDVGTKTRLLVAAAITLNPIAMSQMFTYYVDGALGSLLSLFLMSGLMQFVRPARLDRIVFVVSGALCMTIKFPGVAYVCIVIGLFACACLMRRAGQNARGRLRDLGVLLGQAVAILALGGLLIGFNPYMTHLRDGRHPMYPVAGRDKTDVIVGETPVRLLEQEHNRFSRFAVSFLGATDNRREGDNPSAKIPFTVRMSELRTLSTPDNRIGGFGVFFSGVTLGALLLYFSVRGWCFFPISILGILLILVTSFSNPYLWWARLVPQMSLLPIFLLIPSLLTHRTWVRRAGQVLLCILLLNVTINAACGLHNAAVCTSKVREQMAALYSQCGPGPYLYDSRYVLHLDQLPAYRGVYLQADNRNAELDPTYRHLYLNMSVNTGVTVVKANCVKPDRRYR